MNTRVEIGGFALQVGSPAGTAIEASGAVPAGDEPLRRALEQTAPRRAATEPAFAAEVEEASEATAKIERAVALGKGIGEGKALDPTQLGLEVGALLDCLERLDRKGRHKKSLQMARALATLLMLLKRWVDLLRTLRSALSAAEQLGDQEAIAWAKHELGTLRLAAGDLEGADRDLCQAREIRERIGDRRGLAATERNMAVLCRRLRTMLREKELVRRAARGRATPRLALLALLGAFLFAAAGFAAGSMTGTSDSAGGANALGAGRSNESPRSPGGDLFGESPAAGNSPGEPASAGADGGAPDKPEAVTDPGETAPEPAPVTEPTPELASTPEAEAAAAPRRTPAPPPPEEEAFPRPR
jgi:hypothetical protein